MTRSKKRVIALTLAFAVMMAFAVSALAFGNFNLTVAAGKDSSYVVGSYNKGTIVAVGVGSNSNQQLLNAQLVSSLGDVAATNKASTNPGVSLPLTKEGTAKVTFSLYNDGSQSTTAGCTYNP